ncbi:MAG: T9SS type A sorting domain-containing protein [Flavobacteriales bacterium]
MKKTLLFSLVAISAMTYAQKKPLVPSANALAPASNTMTAKPEANTKTLGVTLWSDNFDNATNWTVDNSGQTGIEYGWNINNVSDGWYSANGINSTGGGNYAELVNGDPTVTPGTQALAVTYNLTTAAPINIAALGGTNQVSLQFEQYGARFNDLQDIQISTDGTNFFSVGNNLDKPVLSASGGSAYSNPDVKIINLATVLPANPGNVWVRFSWTTNFPASGANPNVWITYGWYIDNVKIVTNPTNDLSITSKYWGTAGLPYYQIPTTQTAQIDFEINAFNGGINSQSGVQYSINVNGGAFTSSSPATTIPSLDTATLTVSNPFTPAALGNYTVVHALTADSTDDVPSNNVIANTAFSVTNYIYARDNGTPAGSTSNGTDGFESGNLFDIWMAQTLKGIDVRMLGGASGTTVGTEVFVKLYSIDPNTGDFVFESESDPYIVTATDLNVNKMLKLNVPVNLVANTTYLAVMGAYSQGLKVVNAGSSEPQTSFFFDYFDNTWYYQTSTPWVRMNFDPTIGINEESANIATLVYPNPANEVLNVKMELNNATPGVIAIYNAAGSKVKETSFNMANGIAIEQVSINDLSAGLYTVKITTNDGFATRKFTKK